MSLDLTPWFESPSHERRLGDVAANVQGSQILRIAAEIRALQATGKTVCNLSVGDYSPAEFPVPAALIQENIKAFEEGHTNYPPAIGLPDMRDAVADFYAHFMGLRYPREGVVITSGARPVVYSFFRAVTNPGDRVLNPTPSWNIHYYCALTGVENVRVASRPENGFLTTAEDLEPHIKGARALYLCSPGNPTGTLFDEDQLKGICDLVIAENKRRSPAEGPLYVLFDQVYWPITHGGRKHRTPIDVNQEMAAYTVFVDGISKCFAATGVRVGWGIGPPDVITGMARFTGHAGAWAPKPAQMATLRFLAQRDKVQQSFENLQRALEARLGLLTKGLQSLTDKGLPVTFIEPQGALYITLKVDVAGKRTKAGKVLESNEDIRHYLLHDAGMGIVPFEAFGVEEALSWFRLSVGAVSESDIAALIPRLERALAELT